MLDEPLASLRRDYAGEPLHDPAPGEEPLVRVRRWLQQAIDADIPDPTAMVLQTLDPEHGPDGRVVLLKGIEDGSFVFYTHHTSAKGRQLALDPRASLVFFWAPLARQIRIRGRAAAVPRAKAEAYFRTRPHDSRLGAWASEQSQPLESRAALEREFEALSLRYPEGSDVPMPDGWGGYAVSPTAIELWQGRASRLHDRLLAEKTGESWRWTRLAP